VIARIDGYDRRSVWAGCIGDRGLHPLEQVLADEFSDSGVSFGAETTPLASHACSANAAYAWTPSGSVIAVSTRTESAIPGNGRTIPNPVICPIPTQPDQTATDAGAASRTSGHERTIPVRERPDLRPGT
jgi:hypothetical protein